MLPRHEVLYRFEMLHVTLMVLVEPGVTKKQLEDLTNHLAQSTSAEEIRYTDFLELWPAGPSPGYWSAHSGSHLREKDWSQRAEQKDIDMWSEFMEAEETLVNRPSPSDDAEEKFQRMAERHGLDVNEVKHRVLKVTDWIAT